MRRRYPPGTEVTLNSMEGESHMPPGLKGKVDMVDDAGQIHVNWENGAALPSFREWNSFHITDLPRAERPKTAAIPVTNSRKSEWVIWLARTACHLVGRNSDCGCHPAGKESFRADGGSHRKAEPPVPASLYGIYHQVDAGLHVTLRSRDRYLLFQ